MKREDLKGLNLPDEAIDSIMALHGKDIEKFKASIETAKAEVEGYKTQLTEAGATIESFKALKPEELKAAADDWKAKYEQAEKEYAVKLVDMDFDKDFDKAIDGAKVKYTNEVKSRLKLDELRDANGKFIAERFNEQIGKIKSESIDLFQDTTIIPQIVTGGNNQSILTDPQLTAMRKGAGLSTS